MQSNPTGADHGNLCPCNSTKPYRDCCEPYLEGQAKPKTAEALMRSRYTAFTKHRMDYILNTHDEKTRDDFDLESNQLWAEQSNWLGLEVTGTKMGQEEDTEGVVEFTASFEYRGVKRNHREISQFRKVDDTWYFVDGFAKPQETIKREAPKLGRNDPCACGSGKKFKKCCMVAR